MMMTANDDDENIGGTYTDLSLPEENKENHENP
jgi:hypothetical protein